MKYPDHIFEPSKFSVEKVQVKALEETVPPENKTQLRAFIDLFNVYRRFVKAFAEVAKLLNDPLKKDTPDVFPRLKPEQMEAFQKLRKALLEPAFLALLVPGRNYCMDIGASKYQVGAVFFHYDGEGQRLPIGY